MSKLEELRLEADELGLTYPKNIGESKLQEKINDYNNGGSEVPQTEVENKPAKKPMTQKQKMSKLIRVRVTCNDPAFKKWPGLTRAAGSTTFFRKRFIPFNRETHIEQVLFDSLKRSEYQWFEEKMNRTSGRKYKVPRSSPSFVIEELTPLTKAEYEKLAQDQRSRGSVED